MLEGPNAWKISTNQNRQAFLLAKCLSHKIEVNINRKCIKSVENNKKITNCGLQPNTIQMIFKINEVKIIRNFQSWKLICFIFNAFGPSSMRDATVL